MATDVEISLTSVSGAGGFVASNGLRVKYAERDGAVQLKIRNEDAPQTTNKEFTAAEWLALSEMFRATD